jgi:hypothetical protein
MPAGWAATPFRSLRGLAVATNILLGIAGAVALIAIPVLLNARSVVHDHTSGSTFLATKQVRDALTAVAGLVGLFGLASLAITVLWIIWMWRAASNAQLLARARQRFSPGWAIGGWFIPFANLVIPGLQMADIWRGSADPDERVPPSTGLVWTWWIVFIVGRLSLLAAPGGVRLGHLYRVSELDTRVTVSIAGNVLVAVSAVLAILVVRRITAGQEALTARLARPAGVDPFTAMAAAPPQHGMPPYAAPTPPRAYPPQAYPPQPVPPTAYPPTAYPPQSAPPDASPPAPPPAPSPPAPPRDDDPPAAPPRAWPGSPPSDPE